MYDSSMSRFDKGSEAMFEYGVPTPGSPNIAYSAEAPLNEARSWLNRQPLPESCYDMALPSVSSAKRDGQALPVGPPTKRRTIQQKMSQFSIQTTESSTSKTLEDESTPQGLPSSSTTEATTGTEMRTMTVQGI
ncbi:hypothetical protein RvY_14183 [Ramazzottius varieornatus]|uniref:Uncharacterized protein n=1 Tax=Ramazzottius varieornatus TaxID=947166 RepID=A0A1D1VXQ7_RAMVA|nr:hypothetical protein RvY_14183 [Ramazzottius varieornatus]